MVVGGSVQQGGSRRRRGLGALAAGALAVALAVSGCSGLGLGGDTAAASDRRGVPRPAPAAPPSGQSGLARFYGQSSTWSDCQGFQCARLTVPLDYAKPDGDTVTIAVLKAGGQGAPPRLARRQPRRPGRLGRGVRRGGGLHRRQAGARQPTTSSGSTPAASARSAAGHCLDDRELDAFLGADPTPDTRPRSRPSPPTPRTSPRSLRGQGAAPCWRTSPRSTPPRTWTSCGPRSATPKLDYLGKSYGTYLGATYADLFPAKRRAVRARRRRRARPHARPRSTRARPRASRPRPAPTSRTASRSGGCPLGGSVDEGMQRLRDFLKQLDTAADQGRRPARHQADRGLGLARDRRGDVRREHAGAR